MRHPFKFRLLAIALAATALWGCESEQKATAQAGPPEVEVATLVARDVTLTTELPGRTTALRKAEIRPQVDGIIVDRLFREGAQIEAGQQLYQIDDSRYKAALSTAEAQVAQAEANLTAARARESRYKDLLAENAVSQQEYDDALANFQQTLAALQAAEAAIETARINLEYTKVLAPISGRIGTSSVTEGALVTAGQAQPMAVIQQLDPIYVDVSQSAGELLELRRQIMRGDLQSTPEARVTLRLDNGVVYEHQGTLEFAEVDVNESTGTVVMRALFPNPDQLLLPGMFVRAEISEGKRPDALLIPQRAVTHNREGDATTLVVNAEGKVELREIVTGRALGNEWLVLSGVKAGEEVIVAGVQKVQPGAPVVAVSAKPSPDSATAAAEVN